MKVAKVNPFRRTNQGSGGHKAIRTMIERIKVALGSLAIPRGPYTAYLVYHLAIQTRPKEVRKLRKNLYGEPSKEEKKVFGETRIY